MSSIMLCVLFFLCCSFVMAKYNSIEVLVTDKNDRSTRFFVTPDKNTVDSLKKAIAIYYKSWKETTVAPDEIMIYKNQDYSLPLAATDIIEPSCDECILEAEYELPPSTPWSQIIVAFIVVVLVGLLSLLFQHWNSVWVLTCVLPNALNVTGARHLVYKAAQDYLAYYTSDVVEKQDDIHYDKNDLHVRLLFKSEENAMKFRNAILEMGSGPPHVKAASMVIEKVDWWRRFVPRTSVLHSHYDPSKSVSPMKNLGDLQSDGSPSFVSQSDPIYRFQMLEQAWKEVDIVGILPEKAHLITAEECKAKKNLKKFDTDPNNYLALYRDGLHTLIDGLRNGGIPTVFLIPSDDHTACKNKCKFGSDSCRIKDGSTQRIRVDVIVECNSDDVFHHVLSRMKHGSVRCPAGKNRVKTFVHVTNPATFIQCLTHRESVARKTVSDFKASGLF